ncbi:MAG: peptide chain release factor N(5)-glutamine methyltransferase [Tepidisphaeraceae bacterium]
MIRDIWTIRALLEWTTGFFERKQVDSPRLSAELLLSHVLGVPRIKLYTDYDRQLAERDLGAFRDLVKRAGEHEPVAYLTGRAFFFNLELHVNRDVLIPRPETEKIVENVAQFCRHTTGFESPRILDLCTGCGCIAAALAHHLKSGQVIATDLSPAALAVAKANLERLNLLDRVELAQGDLFDALRDAVDRSPFHIITANPPYIPTSQIETLDRNVRDYEPRLALDGGLDGLAIVREILAGAPERLLPGGRLYVELAFDQGDVVREIAGKQTGLADVKVLRDDAGHERILVAKRA